MNDADYVVVALGFFELLAVLGLGYLAFVLAVIDVLTMALGVVVVSAITAPGYLWWVRKRGS